MVKGKILETNSGDPLPSVVVYLNDTIYSYTDEGGFFSLRTPCDDTLNLRFKLLGYKELFKRISEIKKGKTIYLEPLPVALDNIKIKGNREALKYQTGEALIIDSTFLAHIPLAFGERDVLNCIRNLPGVINTGEHDGGFYVRGGDAGQNAFLMNNVKIFNPNHLQGILSSFNPDAIREVAFLKNGFHPRYGGSLSSYSLIYPQRGAKNKGNYKLGIGSLSSKFMVNQPLKKGKTALHLSGRKSYYDLFAKLYNTIYSSHPNFSPLPDYNFYDLNFNIHSNLSDHSFMEVAGFYSSDQLSIEQEDNKGMEGKWKNFSLSGKYKHHFNARCNYSFISGITTYNFQLNTTFYPPLYSNNKMVAFTNLLDINYIHNDSFSFSGGLFFNNEGTKIKNTKTFQNNLQDNLSQNWNNVYSGGYINGILKFQKTEISAGLRGNLYYYTQLYKNLSPRISITYTPIRHTTFELNYARSFQYNHSIKNYNLNFPADYFVSSSSIMPPEQADQISLGFRQKPSPHLDYSLSLFHKSMKNLIDYPDGANLLLKPIESQITCGKGRAYGIEMNTEARIRNLSVNLNYTLSETVRKFPLINGGETFHPYQDRRHFLNLGLNLDFLQKYHLSVAWYYASGTPITLPIGALVKQGFELNQAQTSVIPIYGDRFNAKLPPTHRMDVSLNYQTPLRKGMLTYNFGIYNVYNQGNPFFIFYDLDHNKEGQPRFTVKKKTLVPFVPTFNIIYQWK